MNTNSSSSEYKLEPFFELSMDLHCIAGYDGYFKRINPAVSNLLGYTEAELFSKPIKEFIHPEDREITAKHRENLLKNNPLLNFENRYVTKGGEIIWLSWTSMPLEEAQLVYAIAKNISHKKIQEEQRNLLLTNFTKINAELKQLNYTTTHDLRAPVNNLLSVFTLLDDSRIQDAETLEYISLLKSAAETLKLNLDGFVEALMEKDSTIHLEEVSFSKCLENLQRVLHALIQNSRTLFKVNFSEFDTILFNSAYLDSIFLNLITNSIKYAKQGHTPVISLYTKKTKGIPQLVFSDNGIGIDMEKESAKIFRLHQKFNTQSDSKGIGLYLVYNHITSLGGSIEVESILGQGTTFTLSFRT